MSIKGKDRLEKAFNRAKHSLEVEGFTVSSEDEKIMKDVVSGKMSREELIRKLKEGK